MDIVYPIWYYDNICPHCLKKESLRFLDRFGNKTRHPIYSVTHLVCMECGTEYPIKWGKKEEKMVPLCGSNQLLRDFEQDIIQYSLENRRKLI